MGRPRVIDRDAVLEAAQTVVRRDGAARLTLEAVAAEAKISKASVLYDYKTKQALVKAVIERGIEAEDARVRQITEALGPVPDAEILGRIEAASETVSDEDRAVALSLWAILAQDPELRKPIQATLARRVKAVLETSEHPRGALLALLAVEGLMSLEWLDLHTWPPNERAALIAEIRWLAGQDPGRVPRDQVPHPS